MKQLGLLVKQEENHFLSLPLERVRQLPEELQQLLKSEGIPTAVHYPLPLNEQQAYRQFCCADCTPISQQRARQVMSLPMSPDMTSIDQGRIIELLARLR